MRTPTPPYPHRDRAPACISGTARAAVGRPRSPWGLPGSLSFMGSEQRHVRQKLRSDLASRP
eukprot:1704466-Alexandrium_andersonii.AAC.1